MGGASTLLASPLWRVAMGGNSAAHGKEQHAFPFAMRYLNINCEKWRDLLNSLGERQRGAVLNAVYVYSQTGEVVEPPGDKVCTAFRSMLPDVKRARAKALRAALKDNNGIK